MNPPGAREFSEINTSIFTLPNRPPGLKNLQTDRIVMNANETTKLEKFFPCLVPERAYVYENQYVDIYFDELIKRGLKNLKTNRIVINANKNA